MPEQGPLSGQTLGGRYLLGDLLGEGGFGVVYAGQHLLLDRPQAIKVLLEHYFRKPKFRERFLREARTVAALDHLHIVHIDDFGMEEQTARAYLVMPFVGGGTFQDILRKRREPLALEQIISYLEQICSALDYAHQRNVVHLDLKPLNLLIHEDCRLLLSDFGLAHLLKQEGLEGGTSLRYGSPHYMAPEHINGQPDKCSDVYSLGIILYQMLVGRRPFEGPTPEAVMMKHLTQPLPPLLASRPELPEELEAVLEKALAKQAEQRYQSAGELMVAFKDALVRPQERVYKAEEERRRAEEEDIRRAEEERARRVEEERVYKAGMERLRKAEAEKAQKTREEARNAREEQAQQVRQRPAQPPQQVPQRPIQKSQEVDADGVRVRRVFHLAFVIALFASPFIPDVVFLLLGILGFFNVSIIAGFNIDLGHRLACLAIGLVGSILTAVVILDDLWDWFSLLVSWVGEREWWLLFGYNFIVGLACLIVGIGGFVDQSFYYNYPLLSVTHVSALDSTLGLIIGVPATWFAVRMGILFWRR